VVRDQLVAVRVRHGAKGVVLSLELTSEGVERRDNLLLDLATLLGSNSGAEGVVGEIASNTDSGRVDHSVFIGGEVGALQLSEVHVGDVLVSWGVLVVLLNDLVEQRSKGVEALVATCIHTDARVGPFATGEDALLEGEAKPIRSVFAGVPDIAGQDLGQKGFGSTREVGELGDLRGEHEVISHHHAVGVDRAVGHLSRKKRRAAASEYKWFNRERSGLGPH
jgi:hypothetical protein